MFVLVCRGKAEEEGGVLGGVASVLSFRFEMDDEDDVEEEDGEGARCRVEKKHGLSTAFNCGVAGGGAWPLG